MFNLLDILFEKLEWDQINRRARGIISSLVEVDICMQLVNLPSALAMWLHRKKLYQLSSHAHVYAVYQEISLVSQGDQSVQEFYAYMRTLWRQMKILEDPLCQTCSKWDCSIKQAKIPRSTETFPVSYETSARI